jgi:hypothetical protein
VQERQGIIETIRQHPRRYETPQRVTPTQPPGHYVRVVDAEVPGWVVEGTRRFVEACGHGDEPAMYHSVTDSHGVHHVAIVTGDFTLYAARLPRGAKPPRGTTAVLNWSSSSFSGSLPSIRGDYETLLGPGTPFAYKPQGSEQ